MRRFIRFPLLFLVVFSMPHLQVAAPQKPGPKTNTTDLQPEFERLKLTPRSQGSRGTCSVLVVTEAFEYAVSKAANKTLRLSPEYVNWAAGQACGQSQDGAYFHQAIDGVTTYGLCLESTLPYKNTYDPNWSPSKEMRETAERNLRLVNKKLQPEVVWIAPLGKWGLSPANIRKAIDALRAGWPVGIGAAHSLLLVGFEGDPLEMQSGVFHVLDSASSSFRTVDYNYLHDEVGDAFYVRCRKRGRVDLK